MPPDSLLENVVFIDYPQAVQRIVQAKPIIRELTVRIPASNHFFQLCIG